MTGPDLSPRELRVSDAERAHTMTLLERATGRGLIDIHEFSERSAKVIAAKTRADLNRLLLDLPGLQLSGRPYDPGQPPIWSAPPQPVWGGQGQLPPWGGQGQPPVPPADVLQLRGYGSRQFSGNWTVPGVIVVAGVGAGTKLDFTQARLTSHTVTIHFDSNLGGTTHLRVPMGTQVRYDGLEMRGCSLHNGVQPFNGPPPLVLNLVGVKRYGAIHIRQPKKNGLKRLLDGFVDSGR